MFLIEKRKKKTGAIRVAIYEESPVSQCHRSCCTWFSNKHSSLAIGFDTPGLYKRTSIQCLHIICLFGCLVNYETDRIYRYTYISTAVCVSNGILMILEFFSISPMKKFSAYCILGHICNQEVNRSFETLLVANRLIVALLQLVVVKLFTLPQEKEVGPTPEIYVYIYIYIYHSWSKNICVWCVWCVLV